MNYLIGDLQGCCDALERLLAKIDFSPSRDHIYLLGDLVNRGPASLATLRLLIGLEGSATCLLGNHDLHLLAIAHGSKKAHRSDTAQDILEAPDSGALLNWLRQQRMACYEQGWLMVHAGVLPQWTREQTLALAGELEAVLRGPNWGDFIQQMYGNEPASWRDDLGGTARLRCVVNALTRLRFVDAVGQMDFKTKDGADDAPPGHLPWFDVAGRRTAGVPIAFGHWSTLGLLHRPDLLALDTGCVWGGRLTAARVENGQCLELISVKCEQAQKPG
ncbi:symmetrical bis(5'-nucleosyl)-tetraphosphatase [Roseateles oligotrophus]|uniref:bis(5'-nucleosyl)-tetraphosphatase (symmetrical) n=1 Tax=Roseateles oligotrophus TaxID=1769250 RepID=A0ABT2YCA4_9BURK|nr:symmetrical bis(5'-nucleosyl)-tetraphosphatase [Roseateles oligotrophus]MCV2367663.1 symmetrical bis(5'-nucleosyl)-tetraphosphatase [Roseateles oligotrophus]